MKEFNPFLGPSLDGKINIDKLNGQITSVSGTTPVTLMGNRQGQQGFFVALPGYDARNATDAQLLFNSNQNVPKIVRTGTFTLAAADFANSGNSYLTKLATHFINHSDVTAPIVWVFIEDALAERIPLPYYAFNYDTGALSYQAVANISDTSTAVEVRSTAALSPGVSFRYYILQETAAAS